MTYLVIINALGFILMSLDKLLAKLRRRRIPEAMLLGIAAMGGGLGSTLAMFLVRHKTQHPKFRIGLPLMALLQLGLLFFILFYCKGDMNHAVIHLCCCPERSRTQLG